jgi:hypothetical protein
MNQQPIRARPEQVAEAEDEPGLVLGRPAEDRTFEAVEITAGTAVGVAIGMAAGGPIGAVAGAVIGAVVGIAVGEALERAAGAAATTMDATPHTSGPGPSGS